MHTIWVITRLTFAEAARRKIVWIALGLGILFLAVFAFGYHLIRSNYLAEVENPSDYVITEMASFFALAGLYAVNFLSAIMTIIASVDTLAGEINSGTMQTLVTKPVKRWQILLGKWLGYLAMMTLYLLFMSGGVNLTLLLVGGYSIPNAVPGIALMWMASAVLLSLTFLGGTRLSTLANGVMVLGLYGIAFVGGWIEQIGAMFQNQASVNMGIISSLIVPSEALWRRAAYETQSNSGGMLTSGLFFGANSIPSQAMVIYAGLYGLAILFLAIRRFHNRDL